MPETSFDAEGGKDKTGEERAAHYRGLAKVHAREAARCDSDEMRDMQLRLSRSYLALAENEEWLAGKTVPHGPDGGEAG